MNPIGYLALDLLYFALEIMRGLGIGNWSLESGMAVAVVIGCSVGPDESRQFDQLDHEKLDIGMLAAVGVVRSGDKLIDLLGRCSCEITYSFRGRGRSEIARRWQIGAPERWHFASR